MPLTNAIVVILNLCERCASQYKVADISQADFGRLEIDMAEAEMPGLMACRSEFGSSQPFKGARTMHF